MYGRAVVWAVLGDCPTEVPIGSALSAAQTTPLFVTELFVTELIEKSQRFLRLFSLEGRKP